MKNDKSIILREMMRLLERKLGLIEENQLSCCQITLAQCHALIEIGRVEKISLNDLANIIGLDNSTMSRTVNNLAISSCVERIEDQEDRRFIIIKLTDEGKIIFNKLETRMNQYYEDFYQSIPVNKRDQVLESLQIINQLLDHNKCC